MINFYQVNGLQENLDSLQKVGFSLSFLLPKNCIEHVHRLIELLMMTAMFCLSPLHRTSVL